MARAAKVSTDAIYDVSPSLFEAIESYKRKRVIDSKDRHVRCELYILFEAANALLANLTRSREATCPARRKLSPRVSEKFSTKLGELSPEALAWLARRERRIHPLHRAKLPRSYDLQTRAEDIVALLAVGLRSPKWHQQLQDLFRIAREVELAFIVARGELSDIAIAEVRERRKSNARKRIPALQRKFREYYLGLSKPAKKRLECIAREIGVATFDLALPDTRGTIRQRARLLLKIEPHIGKFEASYPLLNVAPPKVDVGRPSNVHAQQFVGSGSF